LDISARLSPLRKLIGAARETAAACALQGSPVSLAALLGSELRDPSGGSVARLSDVVVHWTMRGTYPTARARLGWILSGLTALLGVRDAPGEDPPVDQRHDGVVVAGQHQGLLPGVRSQGRMAQPLIG